ncbi:uncharacterized protein MYU51_009313 [Penicillium brevicompactum]|uniref:uncharacterized protein n=1 Tax=Penicillium brevicompactum TaxID=5074 RepID=UPI0025424A4E|nr:uncharacterized protein N7506_010680 [Penicillium brevicompactum]KAJ5327578.1 hypothetical protein N7506_010680 [Penicillium brevicompactum]
MTQVEGLPARARSSFLPVFPLELWDIIIGYLDDGESAQNLSRLSQANPALREIIEPRLYQPVRLNNSESGARLARTIKSRPDLAPLIREIQHKKDSGHENHYTRYLKFYQMILGLPNLETLFLRNEIKRPDTSRWSNEVEFGSEMSQAEALQRALQEVSIMTIGRYRYLIAAPLEDSSFSPPTDEPLSDEFWEQHHTLSGLYNPSLKGLPALRVCHVGSHCDLSDTGTEIRAPTVNGVIFRHPGLRKLCLTGCVLTRDNMAGSGNFSTELEELTVLNCLIKRADLRRALEWPKSLKRFTFRTTDTLNEVADEFLADFSDAMLPQKQGLYSVDYDCYWGGEEEADFSEMESLKHITTTLSSLTGRNCEEPDIEDDPNLPRCLESLTLRFDEYKAWALSVIYEFVKSEKLPHLRRFTCEVPEPMESLPSINPDKKNPPCLEICQEGDTWKDKFKELDVDLSMVPVPYPLEAPKYNLCSCEHLDFYHRLPSHPHVPNLRIPWEEEDSDWNPWADDDTGDEHEGLDEVIDDFENDADDF